MGVREHLFQAGLVLLDIDVTDATMLREVLPGLRCVRSGVLAVDDDFLAHSGLLMLRIL